MKLSFINELPIISAIPVLNTGVHSRKAKVINITIENATGGQFSDETCVNETDRLINEENDNVPHFGR